MQTIEYRRFIRHPLCLPLSFTVVKPGRKKTEDDSERSKTINVSLGGLLFPSKKAVAEGSGIVIKMPFESKVFNIRANVVRCVKRAETKLYDIAVSFSRPQEAFKVKMIEQIYLIAEYRDLLRVQTGKEVTLEEASLKWIKRYSARFSRLYW
jgi:c-di-GMP-binding flagellar brake protein YcgR